ncbi:hypothetical protein R1T43_09505 [Alteromonas sp. CI.11.F.A3]|uniref:hypothetical protein n=1 Tax=unclassified Alteromonas TaxID=2614992 RepID=UPI001B3A670D|nr:MULTISPECIES: hypothetical protein [unclassified Alteromonas]MBQ4830208.1 hypothetical protein [Alteromonas sp. MMG017]WOI39241.1 hypothetical protein R1T43_09505 [Alteromonas sp. CI.11.F.A3]
MKMTLRHFITMSSIVVGLGLSSNGLANELSTQYATSASASTSGFQLVNPTQNSPVTVKKVRSQSSSFALKRLISVSTQKRSASNATRLLHTALPQGIVVAQ